MFPTADFQALLPELFIAVAAMVLLVVGVSLKNDASRMITTVGAAVLVIALAISLTSGQGNVGLIFGGAFAIDAFSQLGRVLIYGGAAITLLMATVYFDREGLARFEYAVLVLLAAVGMGIMVTAHDLIAVYMGIELQSLSLYVMAAFNRDSRRSTEAGLKYFVLGALSSGLLLYGASLIYGFTGATRFDEIAMVVAAGEAPGVGLVFGLVFFMAGLAFKVSGAPFHMWTPDVYEGAPTPVTAFFAAAPKQLISAP